jgi:hypothetical protein
VLAVVALALGGYWLAQPHRAAAGSSLSVCTMDNTPGPSISVVRVRGRVVGATSFGTWGTSRCLLRAQLTFAVKRFSADGQGTIVQGIEGNPAAAKVNLVLRPGRVVVASRQWRNWCGPPGRFQLQAFWGQPWFAVTGSIRPPVCSLRGLPSTLSAAGVRRQLCAPDAYRVVTSLGQGFMQRLIDYVRIDLRAHHSPCVLYGAAVTLAIQRQSGTRWRTLGQIEGNPGHRTMGALISPGRPASVFWAWMNWCGGGGRFRPLAHFDGRRVTGPATAQPISCQDPSRPSTLINSYGHS